MQGVLDSSGIADACHTDIGGNIVVREQLPTAETTELEKARETIRLNEARLESLLRIIQHKFTTAQDLLDFALEEGIRLTGSRIGFIHLYDEGTRQFTRNSWSRGVMDECGITGKQPSHPLDSVGMWAEAVRRRSSFIVNDFPAGSHRMRGYPEGHAPLHRFMSIPVFCNAGIVAAIGVANKAADYDEADARQLTLLMDTVWKIVQQKRTEDENREGEKRLRVIFDASQAGIIMMNPDGVITFANRRMAEMFGCRMEELIGSSYHDHLHPDETESDGSADLLRSLSGENDRAFTEHRYLSSACGYFWGHLSLKRLDSSDGQLQSLVGIITDISDRKLAEDSRNNILSFVETLLAQSPLGIRIFDGGTGACILANRTAVEISGIRGSDLLKQNFRQIESWRKTGLTAMAESVLRDGLSRRIETELAHTPGRKGFVASYLSRIMVEEKSFLMVTTRDISERKRLEEENRRIEAQMLHVQKLESLGVLAGGIAHDFNNILTTVLGNADLALMQLPPSSPVRENVERIERAASRAAELARQMLAYSGKGHFIIEKLDLNSLVEEMTQILNVSISKKVELRFNPAPDLPAINADATQLRQVIMNLVINASEAIGDRNGVISIATSTRECDRAFLSETWIVEQLPEGRYVVLEVIDSGCGMDPETAAKIFEPFFSTKFAGRGLGMAVTLGIIRGHRGAITLVSEQDRGTTFQVLLPAAERIAISDEPSPQPDEGAPGSGTVLLVDDEQTIRSMGEEMLSILGFRVLTAADGYEALQLFGEHREEIDCVILDLTMPRMDGEQTFRELRGMDPGVRVIMCSGYSEQEISERFVSQGLTGFIQKPFKLTDLERALMNVAGAAPVN